MASCGDLACPVWVQFIDPETRAPYFYNMQTHEQSLHDPDPSGKIVCDIQGDNEHAEQEDISSQMSACWHQRPARVQVQYDPTRKTQYVEGHYDFNIWYGKFENDRFDRKDREPASYRLSPIMDCGWTLADCGGKRKGYFCIFFAQGCCSKGSDCTYHHHIPSFPDGEDDMVHDIFGRLRFSSHRDDMGGVGSFNTECRTLYVGDLRFDRSRKDALQLVEQQLWEDFGQFGKIEEIRVIPQKAIAFLRFASRAVAEFAKIAMMNQKLGLSPLITVRWAFDDPDPRSKKRSRAEMLEKVESTLEHKITSMGLSEVEVASLKMQASNFKACIAPYPDTSSQFK